jgi:predicted ATPase/DNA-binding SARP family transcriptional activator/tetratricopeptide (TPR) repeat protein
MSELKLSFLGSPQIEVDGGPVVLSRRKSLALLAYLAVTAVPHTREHLATLLWPNFDQSKALAYLRRALWDINQVLGEDWLSINRERVYLPPSDSVWVDGVDFQGLVDAGGRANLEESAALYRGDFLTGFTLRDALEFDDWQYLHRESYRRQLGECLQVLVDVLVEDGEMETAVSYARRWLTLDNLNEVAHRQLMLLYALQGKRAEAIQQYGKCVDILETELDIAPDPATTALLKKIKKGEIISSSQYRTADRIGIEPAFQKFNRLPIYATPFVGRKSMVDEICSLIENPDLRLITLVGPGGSGKTRLAIQAASLYTRHGVTLFSDGVVYVSLELLNSADEILSALISALNLSFLNETDDLQTKILEFLSPQNMLLVFDNYEHLISREGLQLPVEILNRAPNVKILATSREWLNVRGEQVVHVSGMNIPSFETAVTYDDPNLLETYSAIQLFRQQARLVRPDFSLTLENGEAVVQICHLLEGTPLAIELAASWLSILTPSEIVAEIERTLDFLETNQHDLPDRQRSLRTVFEYSWNLLSPTEQVVYKKLSFFQGSFTREAAQAVSGVSLRDLMGFVNKSLLWRHENGRYQQHTLLREYAAEYLDADEQTKIQVSDRFSSYFMRYFLDQAALIKRSGKKENFDAIEKEIDNICRAWLWFLAQGDYKSIMKSLDGIYLFSKARPGKRKFSKILQEGLDLIEKSLSTGESAKEAQITQIALLIYCAESKGGDPNTIEPKIWAREALFLLNENDLYKELGFAYSLLAMMWNVWYGYEEAKHYLEHSLKVVRARGNTSAIILALINQSGYTTGNEREIQVRDYLYEALNLSRQMGNDWLLGMTLLNLGNFEFRTRNYEQAIHIFQDCLAILKKLNVPSRTGLVYWRMGDVYDAIGQYQQAIDSYQMGCDLFRQMKAWRLVASSYSWQSIFSSHLGDLPLAESKRRESLKVAEKTGDTGGVAWAYWEWGELCRIQGEYEQSRQYYEASMTLFREIKRDLGTAYYHRGLGELALQQEDLEEALAHYNQSKSILENIPNPMDRSWALAYVECGLGRVWSIQGKLVSANSIFQESFRNAQQHKTYGLLLYILAGVMELYVAKERFNDAFILGTFISNQEATYWETKCRVIKLLADIEVKCEVEGETADLDLKNKDTLADVFAMVERDLQRE